MLRQQYQPAQHETMQSSKAQLELQFNWIFVLIVGAILLTFFFTLIGGQSRSNEQLVAINFAERMKTILDASEQQAGTIKLYERLPPLSITFTCDTTEDVYQYHIEGADPVDTKYNIFFSPRELNKEKTSKQLYTWTESWNIPFQVANFLYISNDRHEYVFYKPETYANMRTLYESFPKNFSERIINVTTPDVDKNMDSTTYVFFRNQLSDGDLDNIDFVNTKGKILVIEPASNPEHGRLHFIHLEKNPVPSGTYLKSLFSPEFSPSISTSTYLGEESMYGAILSENKVQYECAMKKALHRLQIISLMHYYRTQEIIPVVSTNCKYLLNFTTSPEQTVCSSGTGAASCLLAINDTAGRSFTNTTVATLVTYLNNLDNTNRQLAILANCPPIY